MTYPSLALLDLVYLDSRELGAAQPARDHKP
jgi:hypothetical protein